MNVLSVSADIYTDPVYHVNYYYYNGWGSTSASVAPGRNSNAIGPAGSPEASGDIVILDQFTVNGKTYNVVKIDNTAFCGCSGITSVTIPESITEIGNLAFSNCSNLKNIPLPNSLISIGDRTFYGCASLTSVAIPNSVTRIGEYIFYGCKALTSVVLPDNMRTLPRGIFIGCESLTSFNFPSSLEYLGEYAFSGCKALTSVVLPDNIKTLPNNIFSNCENLSSFNFPSALTSLGKEAFRGCKALTSVVLPDNIKTLPQGLFSNCTNLSSVHLPSSLESLEGSTFSGCSNLTSIDIPTTVKKIVDHDFLYCGKLNAVNISDLSSWCKISFGDEYANPTYYAKRLFLNGEEIEELVVPDGISEINKYTFCGLRLKSLVIPNSTAVRKIYTDAFFQCGINEVHYPSSSLYMYGKVFGSVSSVYAPSIEWLCRLNPEAAPLQGVGNLYVNGERITDLTIPNGVGIGSNTFKGFNGLQSVIIPNNTIGQYAFADCYNLKSVKIGGGVSMVYDYAFQGCSRLEEVIMEDGLGSISRQAFGGCGSLKST